MYSHDINPTNRDTISSFNNTHSSRIQVTKYRFHATNLFELKQENSSKPHMLTTGCSVLNELLHGGISLYGGIIEICSEAGCGKSQLGMQLCLHCQLPAWCGGLEGAAIYINTESSFNTSRLCELSTYMSTRHQWIHDNTGGTYDWLEYIYIKNAASINELERIVNVDMISMLEKLNDTHSNYMPIKLIVIDSIASVWRTDRHDLSHALKHSDPNVYHSADIHSSSDSGSSIAGIQADRLFSLSSKLKSISSKYEIPIIVMNQATDLFFNADIRAEPFQRQQSVYSSGRCVMPALGLSWAHCVNTRIMLSRDRRHNSSIPSIGGGVDSGVKREIHVIFSNYMKKGSCLYTISAEGIYALNSHLSTSTAAPLEEFATHSPEHDIDVDNDNDNHQEEQRGVDEQGNNTDQHPAATHVAEQPALPSHDEENPSSTSTTSSSANLTTNHRPPLQPINLNNNNNNRIPSNNNNKITSNEADPQASKRAKIV